MRGVYAQSNQSNQSNRYGWSSVLPIQRSVVSIEILIYTQAKKMFGLLGPRCWTGYSVLDAGLSCTKEVWYIYDWDTGSSILICLVKSCLQALPVCSLVNNKGIESPFLCKTPRPSARVLTLKHAPTFRQKKTLTFVHCSDFEGCPSFTHFLKYHTGGCFQRDLLPNAVVPRPPPSFRFPP